MELAFIKEPPLNIHRTPTCIARLCPLHRLLQSGINLLPCCARSHFVACLSELIGTIFFYFLAFAGTQVAFSADSAIGGVTPDDVLRADFVITQSVVLQIALAVGFSLAVSAWVFWRISGGLFNPMITLGFVLIGALTFARGLWLLIVQTAGVIIAGFMVKGIFPGPLNIGTVLQPDVSAAQGFLIEMVLTTQLVLTVFMLAGDKHEVTILAPIGIGLSAFVGQLYGVFWTGASMNPFRYLATSIVNLNFNEPGSHWVYWAGPLVGTLWAVFLYRILKVLELECAKLGEEVCAKRALLPSNTQEILELPSAGAALESVDEVGPSVPLNTPVPVSEYAVKKLAARKEEERKSTAHSPEQHNSDTAAPEKSGSLTSEWKKSNGVNMGELWGHRSIPIEPKTFGQER